jgi:hypothetical protein
LVVLGVLGARAEFKNHHKNVLSKRCPEVAPGPDRKPEVLGIKF